MPQHRKKYSNKRILVLTMIAIIIIALSDIIFIRVELDASRSSFIKNYKQEQLYIANTQAKLVETLLQGDRTVYNMISIVDNKITLEGKRWKFLIDGEDILYYKDRNTTNTVSQLSASKFLERLKKTGMFITITDIEMNGTVYYYGIASDKVYTLTQWRVTKHDTFIMIEQLAVVLISVILSVLLLWLYQLTLKKLYSTRAELIVQNSKVEHLNDRIRLVAEIQEKGVSTKSDQTRNLYDSDVMEMLIAKTDKEPFYPVSILLVKMNLGDMYFTKAQMYQIAGDIKRKLQKKYVMAETSKGEFTILMCQTNEEESDSLRVAICNYAREVAKLYNITIRVAVATTNGGGEENILVFNRMRQEIDKIEEK